MDKTYLTKKIERESEHFQYKMRWAGYIVWGTLLAAAIIIFYFFYLLLWPVKIIEIKNDPVPVYKKAYHAGEFLTLNIDYCKYIDLVARHQIDFVNHTVTPTLSTVKYLPVGCHSYDYEIPLPRILRSGQYHIEILLEYQVNSIRKTQIKFKSEDFWIVGGIN